MDSERLRSELQKIEFERVELGFGSQDARSQLDTLKARWQVLPTGQPGLYCTVMKEASEPHKISSKKFRKLYKFANFANSKSA